MSADWYAYKTKAGETLFFYNTKTREHRWAKKCNRLQFELIKNEYDDHNNNCATSNGMRAENSPSVWRPYNSVKSGKTLFYYNIITGEHKWDLNPDELSSSIPSEPVSLRDDVMDASSFRNEDHHNGNTMNLLVLGDPIEVKKENDHHAIDEETQNVTENEPEIQQTSTAENQPEKQFLEELNYIEPNSGFMALRSTVKKRNISYGDSSQATLQQNSYSAEYLSDDISSSDDDDCSNFSDELPDISTSESEEEEEEDERARKNRRRSKYDLQNLNGKNSSLRKSVGVSLNDDGLSHDKIREENQGQQACVRQSTSTHENITRMNGTPTIRDITNANLKRVLFHRHELKARSTSNDSMPTIACAFSINSNDLALKNVGFKKSQSSIDSTVLSIYQPQSEFRCETNTERSGNISAVAQINGTLPRIVLNPNLEKDSGEHACSITKEGKIDTQSIPSNHDDNMPAIGEVFSLPETTAKLEVAKLKFEKANRSLENTILSIYRPRSQFSYEASPAVCNSSVQLQKPDDLSNVTSNGRQEAQNSYTGTTGTSAFDEGNHFSTPSLQMTQSVEERYDNEADCHLSKPTTGEDSESKIPSKDPEDVSLGKYDLKNENLLSQSKDSSESSSCNLMSSSTEGSILEPEQVVSDRGFEQEEEGYATMLFKSHDNHVSNHSLEMHVKEQEKVNDTVEGSQHSQQASNQNQNHEICSKDVVESDVSDPEFAASRAPERENAMAKTSTSTQEQPTNLNNVSYRYHYSIKCLLPMIGIVPTHADTGNIRCDNLRPTMILSSRYLGVLSNSNSLTASNTSRPDRTEPLSSTTTDGDKDDPLTPVIAGSQNDPRTSVNRSERNDSLPNQEERTNCAGLDHDQVLSPLSNNKSYLPPSASFMASENALEKNITTTFENHVSYRRDTLKFSDAGTFNGLPYILENLYARYKCCYCGKDFRIQEELKRHLALRHLLFGGVFLCNSCDDSFISQEEFAKHLLLHDEVKPVKCRHCKEEFVTVEELACHLSNHADDPKYPQYEKRRLEKGSTNETLDQDGAEYELEDKDKPKKRRNCSYCDKTFKHYFAFRLHLRTHSRVNDFTCLLCGKWYLDLTSLRKHVVIHLREKCLECDICHKTFRFHSDYLQHQLVHVKGQLFRCENRGCREVFKTWDELRQHEIAMHEERRYRCTQCGKSFSRQEKLQNHILLHTGEKPLECEKCGRRFRIRRVLRNHEKIHFEAKTFKCPVCSKGFKQKCSMLRHVKTHNPCPKEYQCNQCEKRFTQSCSLQRHLRIHSGERFKCPKCSMKFLEAWRMRVHIAKKHSEE